MGWTRPSPARWRLAVAAPTDRPDLCIQAGLGFARGAQVPGAVAGLEHGPQHLDRRPGPVPARPVHRPRQRAPRKPPAIYGRSRPGRTRPNARRGSSPAATSRRRSWPAGAAPAGCCCWTSRPRASTSAPAPRSTGSSPSWPPTGSGSSWSPASWPVPRLLPRAGRVVREGHIVDEARRRHQHRGAGAAVSGPSSPPTCGRLRPRIPPKTRPPAGVVMAVDSPAQRPGRLAPGPHPGAGAPSVIVALLVAA